MIEYSFIIDGVTYIRVNMPCPVDEEYIGYDSHLWQHAGCGGDIYLGDNATFYCGKCHEVIPCMLANYKFSNHENSTGKYIISRAKKFPSQFPNIKPSIHLDRIGLRFLNKLTQSLIALIEEYPSWEKPR